MNKKIPSNFKSETVSRLMSEKAKSYNSSFDKVAEGSNLEGTVVSSKFEELLNAVNNDEEIESFLEGYESEEDQKKHTSKTHMPPQQLPVGDKSYEDYETCDEEDLESLGLKDADTDDEKESEDQEDVEITEEEQARFDKMFKRALATHENALVRGEKEKVDLQGVKDTKKDAKEMADMDEESAKELLQHLQKEGIYSVLDAQDQQDDKGKITPKSKEDEECDHEDAEEAEKHEDKTHTPDDHYGKEGAAYDMESSNVKDEDEDEDPEERKQYNGEKLQVESYMSQIGKILK